MRFFATSLFILFGIVVVAKGVPAWKGTIQELADFVDDDQSAVTSYEDFDTESSYGEEHSPNRKKRESEKIEKVVHLKANSAKKREVKKLSNVEGRKETKKRVARQVDMQYYDFVNQDNINGERLSPEDHEATVLRTGVGLDILASGHENKTVEKKTILVIATTIVERGASTRQSLIDSLRRLIQDTSEQVGVSAASALTSIKIQSLAKANQILTNGILNFLSFLPSIVSINTKNIQVAEQETLVATFDVLQTMHAQIHKEVDHILDEKIPEDHTVVVMLESMENLIAQLFSQVQPSARAPIPEAKPYPEQFASNPN